jgi:hypothetical protein
MFNALAQEIAMDFVTDNPKIMFFYNSRYLAEFFFCPDPSRRILWIAPDKKFGKRIGGVFF